MRTTAVVFFILVATVLLTACATVAPRAAVDDATVIWSDANGHVWLEPPDVAGAAANDHPLALTPGQARAALAALQVEDPDGGVVRVIGAYDGGGVFTEDMLDRLADPVAEALGAAGPGQDVMLSVRGFRSTGWSRHVGKTVVTSARLFHRDGDLHVIVGELNTELDTDYRYGRGPQAVETARLPVPHGSRARRSSGDWILAETGAARRVSGNGGSRDDWVRVELAALQGRSDGLAGEIGGRDVDDGPAEPVARERLRRLRDMHEEGLIPDDIYRRRVEEIVDDL